MSRKQQRRRDNECQENNKGGVIINVKKTKTMVLSRKTVSPKVRILVNGKKFIHTPSRLNAYCYDSIIVACDYNVIIHVMLFKYDPQIHIIKDSNAIFLLSLLLFKYDPQM